MYKGDTSIGQIEDVLVDLDHAAVTAVHARSAWERAFVAYCLRMKLLMDATMGRGILLWLLGVPIPIILLLALFWR